MVLVNACRTSSEAFRDEKTNGPWAWTVNQMAAPATPRIAVVTARRSKRHPAHSVGDHLHGLRGAPAAGVLGRHRAVHVRGHHLAYHLRDAGLGARVFHADAAARSQPLRSSPGGRGHSALLARAPAAGPLPAVPGSSRDEISGRAGLGTPEPVHGAGRR